MSLMSYPALARAIREKNRGRKNEVMVDKSPEMWAKFSTTLNSDNIQVWYEHNYHPVATLRPDNSLTIEDLPPKHRMMHEMGTWKPEPAITREVKDFCTGKISKHSLSARDILTIVSGCPAHQIIGRLFAEAV